MKKSVAIKKVCKHGHIFYKSSDCPVCPTCEKQKTGPEFFSMLAAPARRALERAGLLTLQKLSNVSEKELLQLHGMGPGSIPKLKKALREQGLSFKKS